jgi:DNA ligase-associated metallophosphoesterase
MSAQPTFHALPIEIDGLAMECLALRALWWPQERTLFVADVHLGKAESFRALGVPVPAGAQGPTAATLDRLDRLLAMRQARTLVVLGDLLHARAAQSESVMGPLAAWRARHAALDIRLLRGNHDGHAGDPPPHLGIEGVDAPARLGPFCLQHEPRHAWTLQGLTHARPLAAASEGRATVPIAAKAPKPVADERGAEGGGAINPGIALSGHVHPVIRLTGRAGDRARLPCFCIADDEIVLPAFGAFTGGAPVQRRPDTRCVVIADDQLFLLG